MVKELRDICLGCIQTSLQFIPQVHTYLPVVYKELLIQRLAQHNQLTDSYLRHITYNLFVPSLKRINLYKCDQVTDKVLHLLSSSGCKLNNLHIQKCIKVTDKGVLNVTQDQDELVTLTLHSLPKLTSKGLVKVISPCLENLNLQGCSAVTGEGVLKVVLANPGIKVLKLKGIQQLDDSIFPVIAKELGQDLESLDVSLLTMSDVSLGELGIHCPNLQRLNAHGCNRISGKGLIGLSQGCIQLKSLDLSYCNRLSVRPDSEALWTLPTTLTDLSLCGILVDDEGLFVECIIRLRSIKAVKLSGVAALNDQTLTKICEKIGGNLRELDVSGSVRLNLTDEGIKAVCQYCVRIEVLSLSLLENITGDSLLPLFSDTNRTPLIRKLLLSCRKMNVDVLRQVVLNCCNISLLDLSGLKCVQDDLLFSLAGNAPDLTHIGLKGCRQVTDFGICELARRCALVSVVLSGVHNTTDKSIFALANSCSGLEEIYLNGCYRVTSAAVRYLQDCCIGHVSVGHVVPNADPAQVMAKNLDTGEFCRADLLT